MASNELRVGDRVYVVSHGPFRGLRGTIHKVHCIDQMKEDTLFLFYQVALEGTHIKEPIWIRDEEIVSVYQEF